MTTVVLVLAALWLVACLVYISAKRRRRSL
jgi:hypothetical protein